MNEDIIIVNDIQEYIKKVERQIARLKEDNRNTFYDMSVSFGKLDVQPFIIYFVKQGYIVKLERCPRNYIDVIIQWNKNTRN